MALVTAIEIPDLDTDAKDLSTTHEARLAAIVTKYEAAQQDIAAGFNEHIATLTQKNQELTARLEKSLAETQEWQNRVQQAEAGRQEVLKMVEESEANALRYKKRADELELQGREMEKRMDQLKEQLELARAHGIGPFFGMAK